MALRLLLRCSSLLNGTNHCLLHMRPSSFEVGPRKLAFSKKTDLEKLVKMLKVRRHDTFNSSAMQPSSCCVELLANSCEDMDYKMIRERQPFFLHYRLDLLLQRVRYMETSNLTPRQKRRQVERHPPVLMLGFSQEENYSVNYLRGVIHYGQDLVQGAKLVHLLYNCCPKLVGSYGFKIEDNLKLICEELAITDVCALKMAINMPCFLLWNYEKSDATFRVIHRDYGLPSGYHLDLHTAPIYPPVLKETVKLNYTLLTNKPDIEQSKLLSLASLSDVLTYNFATHRGKPEDLSAFLLENSRAEGLNENSDL